MKKSAKLTKNIMIAMGLVLLLTVSASANSADQSIWFQNHSMSPTYDLGSGPTCGFSADAGQSIWFQNRIDPRPQHSEDMTLCSVDSFPGGSIWFHSN